MGIGYCNRCKRYDGHDTNCPAVVGEPGEQQLRSRIEQLTARVRELEEEKKKLQALLDFDSTRLDQIEDELEDVEYLGPFVEGIKVLKTQLAAEQLNNKLLRKALEAVIKVHGYESGIPVEAISTQANTEALDAYIKQKIKEYY